MAYRDDEAAHLQAENARLKEYIEDDKASDARREKYVASLEGGARAFWRKALGLATIVVPVVGGLALSIWLLKDCSCAVTPENGYVTGKHFYQAHTTYTTVCTGSSMSRSCHPVAVYHPARYEVVYADDQGIARVDVPQERYATTMVGDWFCANESAPCHETRVEESDEP